MHHIINNNGKKSTSETEKTTEATAAQFSKTNWEEEKKSIAKTLIIL